MFSLTPSSIQASFVNASRKELADIALPADFDETDWNRLDYLGWRDRKIGRRAYIVVPVDDEPVGIVLRQAEAAPRSRAQCSWCTDITLPNDVLFYSAKRTGSAGRNGNTLATLICATFECSSNVRKLPPVAYLGFDVEAARTNRISLLQQRAAAFASDV